MGRNLVWYFVVVLICEGLCGTLASRSCQPCPAGCTCNPIGRAELNQCNVNCRNAGLTSLSSEDLPEFNRIVFLDLRNNRLTELDLSVRSDSNPALKQIWLSGNKFECNCDFYSTTSWLQELLSSGQTDLSDSYQSFCSDPIRSLYLPIKKFWFSRITKLICEWDTSSAKDSRASNQHYFSCVDNHQIVNIGPAQLASLWKPPSSASGRDEDDDNSHEDDDDDKGTEKKSTSSYIGFTQVSESHKTLAECHQFCYDNELSFAAFAAPTNSKSRSVRSALQVDDNYDVESIPGQPRYEDETDFKPQGGHPPPPPPPPPPPDYFSTLTCFCGNINISPTNDWCKNYNTSSEPRHGEVYNLEKYVRGTFMVKQDEYFINIQPYASLCSNRFIVNSTVIPTECGWKFGFTENFADIDESCLQREQTFLLSGSYNVVANFSSKNGKFHRNVETLVVVEDEIKVRGDNNITQRSNNTNITVTSGSNVQVRWIISNTSGEYSGPSTCDQGALWDEEKEVCFVLVPDELDWTGARLKCEQYGGHLVTVRSEQDAPRVWNSLPSYFQKSVWIGLRKNPTSSTYQWVDGHSLDKEDFNQWSGTESLQIGEQCVRMFKSQSVYTWTAASCSTRLASVCQYVPGEKVNVPVRLIGNLDYATSISSMDTLQSTQQNLPGTSEKSLVLFPGWWFVEEGRLDHWLFSVKRGTVSYNLQFLIMRPACTSDYPITVLPECWKTKQTMLSCSQSSSDICPGLKAKDCGSGSFYCPYTDSCFRLPESCSCEQSSECSRNKPNKPPVGFMYRPPKYRVIWKSDVYSVDPLASTSNNNFIIEASENQVHPYDVIAVQFTGENLFLDCIEDDDSLEGLDVMTAELHNWLDVNSVINGSLFKWISNQVCSLVARYTIPQRLQVPLHLYNLVRSSVTGQNLAVELKNSISSYTGRVSVDTDTDPVSIGLTLLYAQDAIVQDAVNGDSKNLLIVEANKVYRFIFKVNVLAGACSSYLLGSNVADVSPSSFTNVCPREVTSKCSDSSMFAAIDLLFSPLPNEEYFQAEFTVKCVNLNGPSDPLDKIKFDVASEFRIQDVQLIQISPEQYPERLKNQTFRVDITPSSKYINSLWTFSDGSTDTNAPTVSHIFENAGFYSVSVNVSNHVSYSSATLNLTIFQSADIAIINASFPAVVLISQSFWGSVVLKVNQFTAISYDLHCECQEITGRTKDQYNSSDSLMNLNISGEFIVHKGDPFIISLDTKDLLTLSQETSTYDVVPVIPISSVKITLLSQYDVRLSIPVVNIKDWLQFNSSFSQGTGNISYSWSFGEIGVTGHQNNRAIPDIHHRYNAPGLYTVSVTISNRASQGQDEMKVSVQQKIKGVKIAYVSPVIVYESIIFNVSVEQGWPLRYKVLVDETDYNPRSNNFSHSFEFIGEYPVAVVVYNDISNETAIINVTVENPSGGFIELKITGCLNQTYSTAAPVTCTAILKPKRINENSIQYKWTVEHDQSGKVSFKGQSFTNTFTQSGRYKVGVAGCALTCTLHDEGYFYVQDPVNSVRLGWSGGYLISYVGINTDVKFTLTVRGGSDLMYYWYVFGPESFHDILNSTVNEIEYSFKAAGSYKVRGIARNDVSELKDDLSLQAMHCAYPDIQLVGPNSRSEIRSHRVTVDVVVKTCILAVNHWWEIFYDTCAAKNKTRVSINSMIPRDTPSLYLPPRILLYGKYCLSFTSKYITSSNYSEIRLDLEINPSQLKVILGGGVLRTVSASNPVTLDGTLSYDPDSSQGGWDSVPEYVYEWSCKLFKCWSPNATMNFQFLSACQSAIASCNLPSMNSPQCTVQPYVFSAGNTYEITLIIYHPNRPIPSMSLLRNSTAKQMIVGSDEETAQLSIECVSCRDTNLFNVSQAKVVKLVGTCVTRCVGDYRYHWIVSGVFQNQSDTSDLAVGSYDVELNYHTTTTGNGKSNLVIRSGILNDAYYYKFTLELISNLTNAVISTTTISLTPVVTEAVISCNTSVSDDSRIVEALVDTVSVQCQCSGSACDESVEYRTYIKQHKIVSSISPVTLAPTVSSVQDGNSSSSTSNKEKKTSNPGESLQALLDNEIKLRLAQVDNDTDWYPIYKGPRKDLQFYLSPFDSAIELIELITDVVDESGTVKNAMTKIIKVCEIRDRMKVLSEVINQGLSSALLSNDPRQWLPNIIAALLQLNMESSMALERANDTDHDTRQGMRETILMYINQSVVIASEQDIQQLAYALRLITYYVNEFPQNQTMYDLVIRFMQEMLQVVENYSSRGWQGDEFVPEYILDTSGNLIDIINAELSFNSASMTPKQYQQRQHTLRKAMDIIDKTIALLLGTKVVYEEAVDFHVGSLYCWGQRAVGFQIQTSCTSPSSYIKFPSSLQQSLDSMELFQYVTTMAANPYTWGYQDTYLPITSEVVKVVLIHAANSSEVALPPDEHLQVLVKMSEKDWIHPHYEIGSSIDLASAERLFKPRTKRAIQELEADSHENKVSENETPSLSSISVTLLPNSAQSSPVSFNTTSEPAATGLKISAVSMGTNETRFSSDQVNISVTIAGLYAPNIYKFEMKQIIILEWNVDIERYESAVFVFLGTKYSGGNESFYVTVTNDSPLTLNLTVEPYAVECKAYNNDTDIWTSSICTVINSTINWTMCSCSDMTSHTMYGASNVPVTASMHFTPTEANNTANPIVVATVSVMFVFLGVGLLLTWYWDVLDQRKLSTVPLCGPDGQFRYEIIVQTGKLPGSGTTSNVGIRLFGENGKSSRHCHLYRPGAFCRSSQDVFVVATDQELEAVSKIVIWHDNSGKSPDWLLNRVCVRDLQKNSCFHFLCDEWLSFEETSNAQIQKEIQAATSEELRNRRTKLRYNFSEEISEQHIWLSVLDSCCDSTFRRPMRFLCGMAAIDCLLCFISIWFGLIESKSDYEHYTGNVLFRWSDCLVGLVAAGCSVLVSSIVAELFRRTKAKLQSRSRMKRCSSEETVEMDVYVTSRHSSYNSSRNRRRNKLPMNLFDVDFNDTASLKVSAGKLHRSGAIKIMDSEPMFPDVSNFTILPDTYDMQSVHMPAYEEGGDTTVVDDSRMWCNEMILTSWPNYPSVLRNDQQGMSHPQSDVISEAQTLRQRHLASDKDSRLKLSVSSLGYPGESSTDDSGLSTGDLRNQRDGISKNNSESIETDSVLTVSHNSLSTTEHKRGGDKMKPNVKEDLKAENSRSGNKTCSQASVSRHSTCDLTDLSSLGVPIHQLDEFEVVTRQPTAVSCRLHGKPCFPHWTTFILVALVICVIIGTSVTTLVIGHTFSMNIAVRWLIIAICAFFFSIFVLEVLKPLLFAVLHSISSQPLHFYTYQKFHLSVLEYNEQIKMPRIKPLAGFALLQARDDAIKSKRVRRLLWKSMIYLSVIILVCAINYSLYSGDDAYLTTKYTRQKFIGEPYESDNISLTEAETLNDYWIWLKGTLIPNLCEGGTSRYGGFFINVGLPYLRQIRNVPVTCLTSVDSGRESCQSNPGWKEDKVDYLPGWSLETLYVNHCTDKNSSESIESAWCYRTSDMWGSLRYWGNLGWYGVGGYGVTLETEANEIDEVQNKLDILRDSDWLDNRTRAIILEFVIYYSDVGLFSSVIIAAEMAVTGQLLTSYSISAIQPLAFGQTQTTSLLILQSLLCLFAIYFTYSNLVHMFHKRCSCLTSLWFYVDLVIVLVMWTSIGLFAVVVYLDTSSYSFYKTYGSDEFISFYENQQLQLIWSTINAVLLFMLMILAVWQIRYIKLLAAVCRTLLESVPAVISVLFLFCLLNIIYAMIAYLWYGSSIYEFSNFGLSMLSMVTIIRGSVLPMFQQMAHEDVYFATALVSMWSLTVLVLAIGLIFSAMSSAYRVHRKQVYYHNTEKVKDYEMVDHLIKEFKRWLGITRQKPAFRQVQFQGLPSLSYDSSSDSESLRRDVTSPTADSDSIFSYRTQSCDSEGDNSDGLNEGDTMSDESFDISSVDEEKPTDMLSRANAMWDQLLCKINRLEESDLYIDMQLDAMGRLLGGSTRNLKSRRDPCRPHKKSAASKTKSSVSGSSSSDQQNLCVSGSSCEGSMGILKRKSKLQNTSISPKIQEEFVSDRNREISMSQHDGPREIAINQNIKNDIISSSSQSADNNSESGVEVFASDFSLPEVAYVSSNVRNSSTSSSNEIRSGPSSSSLTSQDSTSKIKNSKRYLKKQHSVSSYSDSESCVKFSLYHLEEGSISSGDTVSQGSGRSQIERRGVENSERTDRVGNPHFGKLLGGPFNSLTLAQRPIFGSRGRQMSGSSMQEKQAERWVSDTHLDKCRSFNDTKLAKVRTPVTSIEVWAADTKSETEVSKL